MASRRDILFRYSTNIRDIGGFLVDITKVDIFIGLKIMFLPD